MLRVALSISASFSTRLWNAVHCSASHVGSMVCTILNFKSLTRVSSSSPLSEAVVRDPRRFVGVTNREPVEVAGFCVAGVEVAGFCFAGVKVAGFCFAGVEVAGFCFAGEPDSAGLCFVVE